MAQSAVARERLFALRETIAKLEGKPAPALAAAESEALAEAGLEGAKTENALRLPLGIPALDDAMEGGVPLTD
jgi:protein ImuA